MATVAAVAILATASDGGGAVAAVAAVAATWRTAMRAGGGCPIVPAARRRPIPEHDPGIQKVASGSSVGQPPMEQEPSSTVYAAS